MPVYKKPLSSVIVKPAGADCNMRCSYCFYLEKHTLYPEEKFPRMDDTALEILIRQLMEQSGPDISITWQGGEPTLMGLDFFKKVIELEIKYAAGQKKNIGNCLQTNGSLLNEEWADFLARHHFLVGLSIDGPAFIHNTYRKFGNDRASHDKAEAALTLLVEKNVEFNVLSTITAASADHPQLIYSYFKEKGVQWMQFLPVLETSRVNSGEAAPFSLIPEKFGKFLIAIFDLWLVDFLNTASPPSVRIIENIFHRYLGFSSPECTFSKNCGNYLVIEHNGDVYSCDYYAEQQYCPGNIRDARLIDMLNSPLQEEFGKMKGALDEECRQCRWLSYCNGGCTRFRFGGLEHEHYQFCASMKMFLEYANEAFIILAENWKKLNPVRGTYDLGPHFK